MNYSRSELRRLTLADNCNWLRSFGCTAEERGGLTVIDHPWLQEYRAWLFTGITVQSIEHLKRLVSGRIAGPRTVFVDDDATSPDVVALLDGARGVGGNVTLAGCVPTRAWSSTTRLVAAQADDWQLWSEIYSCGFARHDNATLDAERWRLSFASTDVRHWFFVSDNRRVGVCQTTRAAVHGIYSFTLLPEARGVRTTLNAVRALLAHVALETSPWLYFEVLSQAAIARTRQQSSIGLRTVRALSGYQLPE